MATVIVIHDENHLSKFARDLFAGGAATAVAKTTVAPIERLKLLLQVQDGLVHSSGSKPFKGIIDYFVRVPKEEGVLAFWRGNWANVLRTFPMQSLNFAFKDLYKKSILADVDKDKEFWKFFCRKSSGRRRSRRDRHVSGVPIGLCTDAVGVRHGDGKRTPVSRASSLFV